MNDTLTEDLPQTNNTLHLIRTLFNDILLPHAVDTMSFQWYPVVARLFDEPSLSRQTMIEQEQLPTPVMSNAGFSRQKEDKDRSHPASPTQPTMAISIDDGEVASGLSTFPTPKRFRSRFENPSGDTVLPTINLESSQHNILLLLTFFDMESLLVLASEHDVITDNVQKILALETFGIPYQIDVVFPLGILVRFVWAIALELGL